MATHTGGLTRRRVLAATASLLPACAAPKQTYPIVDYHVHLNADFTLDDAVALSAKMKVKFGIAEHAGTKENQYRSIMSNDRELQQWLARLDGKPVYKGAQAEWIDWMGCFSKEVFAQLDYVLSDAMTMPGKDGQRIKMWQAGFDPGHAAEFMDRYVKWNVEVIEREPLDIFAHPTWLPAPLDARYDELWTEARMKLILQALHRTGTAVEIDAAYLIPRMRFLQMAKAAGLKFSFGSNSGSGPVRGIDFCMQTAKALGLGEADLFSPAPANRKPILGRKLRAE